jgi:hypothetical protein
MSTAVVGILRFGGAGKHPPNIGQNAILHYCNIRQEYCDFPILQHFLHGAGKRNLNVALFLESAYGNELARDILNWSKVPCVIRCPDGDVALRLIILNCIYRHLDRPSLKSPRFLILEDKNDWPACLENYKEGDITSYLSMC